MADIEAKTAQYEELLATALSDAEIAPPTESPFGSAATDFEEMARSYLEDGRHFQRNGDLAEALAAFSYGHAWLDAGARLGLFAVPRDDHLFTV